MAVDGDFAAVDDDFLNVNPDFATARGVRADVDASCAKVGGDGVFARAG
ncbi:MAG: hypothetical protein JO295_11035 [Verrucomicrobia bacterium]|nr:hypothetical protein [Verrucomicrobiota bacterium]